jgi:tetratricopeptide (TPR) repeat protein
MTTNESSTSAAIAEHDAGRFDQAERIYRTRLAQVPNDLAALIGLGDVLSDSRQVAEAEEMYRKAIAIESDTQAVSGAYDGLAAILQDAGDLDGAIIASKKAAVLRGNADDAYGVGNSLEYLGRIDDAIEMFQLAATLRHEFTEAHAKAAQHLMNKGDAAAAATHYQIAVQHRPEVAELHSNLAAARQQSGETNQALNSARMAIELKPHLPEAHNVMGAIWKDRGRWADALGSLGRAVKLKPDYADALNNTGVVLQNISRMDEAGNYFTQAVNARPDVMQFHLNLATNLLLRGDYIQGFTEFEWRRIDPKNSASRPFPQPMWRGEPIGAQTLLIHAEMPIRHTILFLRYMEIVRQRAGDLATIVLEIQPALAEIAGHFAAVNQVVVQGNPLPNFHVHCPLLSLGTVLRTTPQTIPPNVGYIKSASDKSPKLPDTTGKRRVGIAWADAAQSNNGKRDRFCPTTKLTALSGASGVAFFNLDKMPLPGELNAVDLSAEMNDLPSFSRWMW